MIKFPDTNRTVPDAAAKAPFSDCSICLKIFNTFNIDWLHYSESSWRPLVADLCPRGGSGHGVPDLASLMMLTQLVQVSQLMLCCCYCCCYKLSFFSDCCSICLVTSSEVYWCSKTENRKKDNYLHHDLEILISEKKQDNALDSKFPYFNWFHHCKKDSWTRFLTMSTSWQ